MSQLFCTEPIEKYAEQSSEVNPFTYQCRQTYGLIYYFVTLFFNTILICYKHVKFADTNS